jgi:hypothetical protein
LRIASKFNGGISRLRVHKRVLKEELRVEIRPERKSL